MIGTTRLMTDVTGADVAHAAYTAFGGERSEREWSATGEVGRDAHGRTIPCPEEVSTKRTSGGQVGGSPRRYGYAGEHGYQTATGSTPGDAYETGFTFQHLGHRYYDPASGRFLQRDPIGIRGGLNVYAYAGNTPTIAVDPNGKLFGIIIGGIIGGIVGGVVGGVNGGLIGAVAGLVGGTVSGAIAGTGVGAGVAGAAGGAVGGAVAGALGGYGSGKGVAGIAGSAGIGAVAGAVTGGVGGAAVGGIASASGGSAGAGTSAAAGAAGSITSAGITVYYDDLPSAMICAAERLGRRR